MNYICNKCEKKFNRKYNLEMHYKRKISCINNENSYINCPQIQPDYPQIQPNCPQI